MTDEPTKMRIISGVILPTWPTQTAVLQIEGQKQLLVVSIESLHVPSAEEATDE